MTPIRKRATVAVAAAALLLLGAAACGDDNQPSAPAQSASVDDGTRLTMWTRAATEAVSKAYADAYNATHQNKIEVTAYPNEEYPAKLASAAGARALPDIFAADVV